MIKKYFSGECTEAEKEKLLQHFREHPSEVEAFFAEEEWDNVADAPLQETLGTENFLDRLMSEHTATQERKLHWGRWIAAAAVLVFIACTSIYLFKGGKQNQVAQQLVDTAAVLATQPTYTAYKNDYSKNTTYKLPDGSIVTLSPHSEIKYAAAFEPGKRDVYLEGEAVFEVAKDAKRPFTVYCREVATTALGTKFKVSALKDNVHVSVLLIEGKIVVKSTAIAYTGDKYYLLPGNEIQYDRNHNRFTLNNEEEQTQSSQQLVIANPSEEDIAVADEHIQVNTEKKVVRFNDVGMAKVLDILAYKYNVKIAYPPDVINKIRFVGTIRQNDPIEKILSDITQMNNLQLVHDTAQRQYIIR